MNRSLIIIFSLIIWSCSQPQQPIAEPEVFIVVLGIAQDGGYPQTACRKSCCLPVWQGQAKPEKVVSLGLVDRPHNKVYLFDATPDFRAQLQMLLSYLPQGDLNSVGGIFLTHGHIGHYTGLMHLGREAVGATEVPVYAMPRMRGFLRQNGPWSQLVALKNIILKPLTADSTLQLTGNISLEVFLVPHRDEYTETVGFKIKTHSKSALFIPDIDKWDKWDRDIVDEVTQSTYAFLDATFYSEDELPGRDMQAIPHPFVPETMALFATQPDSIKSRINFIHFNHTNDLLRASAALQEVRHSIFRVAREGSVYALN